MNQRRLRPTQRERGAVLVETTLVSGMVLTLLLFSVQVGILGFLQITADAASFVDAHVHSVGTVSKSTDVENATAGTFPQLAPADIAVTPLPAPSASIPVDYQYNGSKAEVAQSQVSRVGGVSMMQPTLIQSNVRPHQVFNMFGNNIGVSGQDIEPQWQECGAHYNVGNASDLTCGGSNPSPNFQVDYFTNGENTPPYFVGFNYIKHCQDAQPWSTCTASGAGSGEDFIAFGVAEYLDACNAHRSIPGISGAGRDGCGNEATFHEAACHQRVYSDLAKFFNNYVDLLKLYQAYGGTDDQKPGTIFNAMAGKAPVSDFATWKEFELNDAGRGADADIQQIYSWDEHVQAGYTYTSKADPGQYPLNPDGGCA